MTTNKELVRQLAEEMAKIDIPILFSDENLSKKELDFDREALTKAFMKASEGVAVKFGAKMFEEGYKKAYNSIPNQIDPLAVEEWCKKEMIQRGLIAEKQDNITVNVYPTKYWFVSYYRKGGPWASEFFLTKVEAEQWIIDNKYSIGSEQIHMIVRNESLGFLPTNHYAIKNAVEEIRALREADQEEYNKTGKTFIDRVKGENE